MKKAIVAAIAVAFFVSASVRKARGVQREDPGDAGRL